MIFSILLKNSASLFYISLILSSCISENIETEEGFIDKIFELLKQEDPTYFNNSIVVSQEELKRIYTDSTKLNRITINGNEINQYLDNLNDVRKHKHKFYAFMYKRIPDWEQAKLLEYNFKYLPLYASSRPINDYKPNEDMRFNLEFKVQGINKETYLFIARGIRFKAGYFKLTDLLKNLSE